MFTKFLDKISDKVAGWIHKAHQELQEMKYTPNPPPPPRPQSIPRSPTTPKDMGFPKELKVKEVTELPQYLKDVSKTIITIEENEMEKVVKVVIDIGPNLADVMKEIINASTSPGESIDTAFGKFLQESARNIVLVLKENTPNEKSEPK